jgi:hypothetical protein
LQIKKLIFNRCRIGVIPSSSHIAKREAAPQPIKLKIRNRHPSANQSYCREELNTLQRGKWASTNQNEEREAPPEANHIENMKATILQTRFEKGKAAFDQSDRRERSASLEPIILKSRKHPFSPIILVFQ